MNLPRSGLEDRVLSASERAPSPTRGRSSRATSTADSPSSSRALPRRREDAFVKDPALARASRSRWGPRTSAALPFGLGSTRARHAALASWASIEWVAAWDATRRSLSRNDAGVACPRVPHTMAPRGAGLRVAWRCGSGAVASLKRGAVGGGRGRFASATSAAKGRDGDS